MVKQLTVTKDNKGNVQSISNGIMNVIINGLLQKWPVQEGMQVGDKAIINNGRLIKIPELKKTELFEV
jgi:hypothetical protein